MAPTSRNRVMLASSKRLYGPPSTNYTDVSRAVARRLRLAPRDHDVAADRSEIEAARLDVARVHRAADAANRQVAVGRDAFERDVAGDRLRRFDVRRAARDDVAADALGAHRAANAGRLHVARDRFQLDRRARRNDDGIVDRHVVVSVAAVLLVLRADVHAPR